VLDTIILDAARAAGADVELGVSVNALTRDDSGAVDGVLVGRGDTTRRIRAAVVVGADGRNSTVAKLVSAPLERFHPATNAGVYTYFQGLPISGYDFRYGDRMSTSALPTNGGTLIAVGVPTEDFEGPEATFSRVLAAVAPDLADAVAGAERVERFRFTPGIESFLRRPTGPGWALVGDAGFTKDWLSAHGLSCALRDADLASAAIHATIVNPRVAADAGHLYRTIRNRFAMPLLEHTIELASYDWDLQRASELMRALGRVTDAECAFLTHERRHASAA
jgi:flavin-dependent dehydrogenase